MTDDIQTSQPVRGWLDRPAFLFGLIVVLMTGAFLVGMGAGFGAGRWSSGASILGTSAWAAPGECATAADCVEFEAGQDGAYGELGPHMPVFREAMRLLYRDFYGELPPGEEAVYAAIRGIVSTLDDPNTTFMEPIDADFFRTNLEGAFEGIGARVSWDEAEDTLVIAEPFEDQPAWLAGLRRDDLILAVDGESLVGSNVAEAVRKIRGPKGSTVVLTVKRLRATTDAPDSADATGTTGATGATDAAGELTARDYEIFEMPVMRDRIEIPTLTTEMIGPDDDIAYVRLTSFSDNAGAAVRQAVRDARENRAQALILDLRGNAGGFLREAVRVAGVFLENETVLLERFNDGTTETYTTGGDAVIGDLPVIVLVNGGSASASEIVAGALQDAQRATLIGSTTFGKGSVQLPHTLSDGSIMRVTIARWYTPLDRTIDGVGLTPDILVDPIVESTELTDTQPAEGSANNSQVNSADPELEAALDFLRELLAEEAATQ